MADVASQEDESRPTRLRPVRLRPMAARDRDEAHRVSTPLELLFDLCFAAAVSQAAEQLGHFVGAGSYGHGVGRFLVVFFAIWWAWVNFTWFASAFDTDDVFYRLTVFVQITGALILAAGVPRIMADHDFALGVAGYVVMRAAAVTQWLRAARGEPALRRTALRYAFGVAAVECCWVAFLAVPSGVWLPVFLVLAVADLAVPAWAEAAGETPWHPHHIAERYGLFTIIVIGEAVIGATTAIQSALAEGGVHADLLGVIAGGLLLVFGMWWVYFAVPAHGYLRGNRVAFVWGYGHYLVFASVAAMGAGITVAAEHDIGAAHISRLAATAAVTVPVAVYLAVVWVLHLRHHSVRRLFDYATLGAAVLILACAALPAGVFCAGLVMAALVGLKITVPHGAADETDEADGAEETDGADEGDRDTADGDVADQGAADEDAVNQD